MHLPTIASYPVPVSILEVGMEIGAGYEAIPNMHVIVSD